MRFSTCRMSTSCSSCSSSFSRRLSIANRSSTACLLSSFSGKCAAMVSARRPASSIPEIEVRISGGIFLFSLTYWSNCCVTARRSASISGFSCFSGGTGVSEATKYSPLSLMPCVFARCTPSTRTLTVPSGNLSICRMLETQPTSNMSSGLGSSLPAAFCATSMICRPASIATSSALIDLGRPTNKGMTMCGKTTTSRNGSSGRVIFSAGRTGCPDMREPLFLEPYLGLEQSIARRQVRGPRAHPLSFRRLPFARGRPTGAWPLLRWCAHPARLLLHRPASATRTSYRSVTAP